MPRIGPSRTVLVAAALVVLLVITLTYWTVNTPATPTAVAQSVATTQPVTVVTLRARWNTLQSHTQHGMLTWDRRMEQMGRLTTNAEQLLASVQDKTTQQAIANVVAEMMDAARKMQAEIEQMPVVRRGERGVTMTAMMGRMESMVAGTSAMAMPMPDPTEAAPAGHDMANMADGSAHDAMAGMGHELSPIPAANVPDATESTGGQPLAYTEEDGVKVFELTARPVR